MVIALSLMRQSEGKKIFEDDLAVVRISHGEIMGENLRMSLLLLLVGFFSVFGALSLAMIALGSMPIAPYDLS